MMGYAQIDDFVFQNLASYKKKELSSVEKSTPKKKREKGEDEIPLSEEEANDLISFLKDEFPDKLDKVTTTDRLKSSPAILVDHMTPTMRFYMKSLGIGAEKKEPAQKMQINPSHFIIKGIHSLHTT